MDPPTGMSPSVPWEKIDKDSQRKLEFPSSLPASWSVIWCVHHLCCFVCMIYVFYFKYNNISVFRSTIISISSTCSLIKMSQKVVFHVHLHRLLNYISLKYIQILSSKTMNTLGLFVFKSKPLSKIISHYLYYHYRDIPVIASCFLLSMTSLNLILKSVSEVSGISVREW